MDRRETTTDCISREQAIDGLCQNCEAFDCIVNGSYCGHDCTEVAILKNLPPVVNQKQVTGKLKTLDDSLLTDDSEACKEQKSKLESDLISRQAAIEAVANHFMTDALIRNPSASNDIEDWKKIAERVLSNLPPVEDMGEVSDGYHTFNQLYHQRAVLFATIVNQNKDNAWKSWKHEDGKFCFDKEGEWFIVGVDTPEGSYTYHYEKKYWDLFDCKELDRGKHWDGHTEDDVVRLLSLPPETHDKRTETHGVCSDCISRKDAIEALMAHFIPQTYTGEQVEQAEKLAQKIMNKVPPVTPTEQTIKEIMDFIGGMNMVGEIGNEAYAKISEFMDDGTPTERTGEWVGLDECSVCGKQAFDFIEGFVEGIEYLPNYCPNCGADMRGCKE